MFGIFDDKSQFCSFALPQGITVGEMSSFTFSVVKFLQDVVYQKLLSSLLIG